MPLAVTGKEGPAACSPVLYLHLVNTRLEETLSVPHNPLCCDTVVTPALGGHRYLQGTSEDPALPSLPCESSGREVPAPVCLLPEAGTGACPLAAEPSGHAGTAQAPGCCSGVRG